MIYIKKNINKYKILLTNILFISFLTGCFQTNMKHFENNTPKLNLFSFFEGDTIAYGIFEDRLET